MRYTFYMLEMEARWFRPLRASLSAMHTTSRPQCLFLFLTRIFSFRFRFFVFFLQGGGSSLKHLRRGLYLEHEEKGHRCLQGLNYVGQVLKLLVYQASSH